MQAQIYGALAQPVYRHFGPRTVWTGAEVSGHFRTSAKCLAQSGSGTKLSRLLWDIVLFCDLFLL